MAAARFAFSPDGSKRKPRTPILPFALWAAATLALPASGAIVDTGDVTPDAPGATGSVASPFRVGNTATGTLAINGSSALTVTGTSNMFVGDAATGIGIVDLTGFDSRLIVESSILVGDQGVGSMTLREFARVNVAGDAIFASEEGSLAELLITDLGTIWTTVDDMAVGDRGRAVVEVANGGRLFSDATDIGNTATGEGRVTVTGASSLWRSTGPLQIGDIGGGRLEVFDQARVENAFGVLGIAAGSSGAVEVAGEGATWKNSGFLTVAASGRGTMHVSEKGRVTSGDARIGDNAGSWGQVTVDGEGSAWNIAGVLLISEPGEGHLTISDGGYVSATGLITIGALGTLTIDGGRLQGGNAAGLVNHGLIRGRGTVQTATLLNANDALGIRLGEADQLLLTGTLGNQGTVDLGGGELEARGTTTNTGIISARDGARLRFGGAGLVNDDDSRLAITSGAVDVFGAVDNNAGAQIIVGGEASAVFHGAVTNEGQFFVQPGGEVLMLGDLNFSSTGTLAMGLASVDLEAEGTDPSDAFAQVQIGGTAALGGTLAVDLLGGYTPTEGDLFPILTAAGGLVGTFGELSLPAIGAGLGWDVLYENDSVSLAVISAAPIVGDFNQDGAVDAADYTLWRDTHGSNVSPGSGADADGNGVIDDADYLAWKSAFGGGTAGGAVGDVASVPEPQSIVLLWAAVTLGALRRPSNAPAR